jgi:hypothetical protein
MALGHATRRCTRRWGQVLVKQNKVESAQRG